MFQNLILDESDYAIKCSKGVSCMSINRIVEELAVKATGKDTLYANEYINYDLVDKGPRDRKALIHTMQKGCRVLDELGAKYWLGRGSVLGLHREKGFLPSDIDIDIDLAGDEELYRIFQKLPFELLLVTVCNGRHQQCAFIDPDTKVVFDIWVYYSHDAGVMTNRNYYGYFWLPEILKENLSLYEFDGGMYPVPNLEWYCEFWYGENWRTPKKYGDDWSVDYRKDCKGFVYTGLQNLVVNNHY